MEKMNKLRLYEMIGVGVVLIISFVFTAVLSNVGINYPAGGLIVESNVSLFQIALYMFISIILYSAFEYAVLGDKYRNFIFAKSATAIAGPFLFLFLTYFFSSITRYTDNSLYVATFFIAISLAQLLSYYFLREGYYFKLMNAYGIFSVILILMIFYVYSANRIFMSPIFQPLDVYERTIYKGTPFMPR